MNYQTKYLISLIALLWLLGTISEVSAQQAAVINFNEVGCDSCEECEEESVEEEPMEEGEPVEELTIEDGTADGMEIEMGDIFGGESIDAGVLAGEEASMAEMATEGMAAEEAVIGATEITALTEAFAVVGELMPPVAIALLMYELFEASGEDLTLTTCYTLGVLDWIPGFTNECVSFVDNTLKDIGIKHYWDDAEGYLKGLFNCNS